MLAASSIGCAGDEPAPVPGDEALTPASFLLPGDYDCGATAVAAPPRPHDAGCFADPACRAPLITAHRMATPFAPENSLSALRAAIALGVDIVETDIRLTADGEVVFIHDGDIDRTLEGSGDVDALTLAELQAIPMKVAGKPADGDFSCDRVPTLDDVFALSRGEIVVELEVKDTEAGVVAATYLRDHDLYGDAFLLCSPSECAAARSAVPDVPIMSRPQEPSEVATEILYDPAPIMVHIDYTEGFLAGDVLASIHGVGAKAFANAFVVADLQAVSEARYEAYREMFDGGLDVLQTELPHLALHGMGRLAPRP